MNEKIDTLTEKIIGAAIEVHKHLGPGLLENVYEEALCHEFSLQNIYFQRQIPIKAIYKGKEVGEYRLDLLIENTIIVEIKSVERFDSVFEAQVLTYLRISAKKVGLLLNFNSRLLKEGIKRFVL